jgi:hypothetical protein
MANEVTITCRIEYETPKAYLITEDGETKIWLPKSQCVAVDCDDDARYVEITLPEYLAKEKGLL